MRNEKTCANKEIVNLTIVFWCVAFIPFVIWLARPKPLMAYSAAEIAQVACDAMQEEIRTQMTKHFECSLNYGEIKETEKADFRWRKLRDSMLAENNESKTVVRLAQEKLKGKWPVLVERGVLNKKWVWIAIASSSNGLGEKNYICPPSRDDLRREIIGDYPGVKVTIISAQAPYAVLN